MQATFSITFEEYKEAQEALQRSRGQYFKKWFALAVIILVCIQSFMSTQNPSSLIPIPLILVLYVVAMPAYLRKRMEQTWERSEFLREPQTVELTDQDFFLKDSSTEAHIPWDTFRRVTETANLFLLHQRVTFVFIPKRIFGGAARIESARQLLLRNVETPAAKRTARLDGQR